MQTVLTLKSSESGLTYPADAGPDLMKRGPSDSRPDALPIDSELSWPGAMIEMRRAFLGQTRLLSAITDLVRLSERPWDAASYRAMIVETCAVNLAAEAAWWVRCQHRPAAEPMVNTTLAGFSLTGAPQRFPRVLLRACAAITQPKTLLSGFAAAPLLQFDRDGRPAGRRAVTTTDSILIKRHEPDLAALGLFAQLAGCVLERNLYRDLAGQS